MKLITMFEIGSCPYCIQAHRMMEELMQENPKYKALTIKIIDEDQFPDIADQYDYYYVPTYYVENEKLHEGVPHKKIIQEIFERALK
jgi:thiol-disulfide isomerase/thioredoxin